MKKLGVLISFMAGCAVLVAAFGIGYANWGTLANRIVVMQTLMSALAVVAVLLVAMGALSQGKERWKALTLSTVLVLGFSALTIFSIGWIIALLALPFLVFFLLKLRTKTELVWK